MMIATNTDHRFLNLLILSVPDEDYSRNASCTLNLIYTCLFFFITVNMKITLMTSKIQKGKILGES